MADTQANDNNTCVVCFKNVLYYSIGECDHPVCFECSTRMRVLCLQNECPICRKDLARVVFMDTVQPYKDIRNKVFADRLFERQFKIGFSSDEIKAAYELLLENRCKKCDKIPPFRTFNMLSDHMRKVHERHYCDLCVKHLKIFTSERKCYTRQELAHHRRKGDLDDTSHRGHPLCEFCEERFMDADELYRHLRKEHLYCHLCDADGRNLYYATHSALAQHFRTDHYLCEEGECAGQHLTAVFRSEIDLKAHKATAHGRGLNRGAARQARTLELQFNITPHPVAQRAPRERVEAPPQSPPPTPALAPNIDTRSDAQFPRLSAAPPAPSPLLATPSRAYKGADLTCNEKNFPSLGGGQSSARAPAPASARPAAPVAATVLRNSKPSVSIQLQSQPASASNFRLTQTGGNRISIPQQRRQQQQQLSDDDFPSLGLARDDHPSIGASSVQPAKVTLINSDEMNSLKISQPSSHHQKKSHLRSEAFPALSSTAAPAVPPQWITVAKPKEKGKPKVEPAPPPRQAINAVSDFPNLPANKAKPKKPQPAKPQSQSPPQVQPQPQNPPENTKKKHKKQLCRKEIFEDFIEPDFKSEERGTTRGTTYISLTNTNISSTSANDKKIKTIDASVINNNVNKSVGNGDFSLTTKEYPPLSKTSSISLPENPPPAKSIAQCIANGAPPGFKVRAAPACNGMTFTNSAGQTFPAPAHAYIPPPDFELRNRELVKKFAVALGGAAAVEDFKVASRAFRDSAINADEFYKHCKAALGAQLESVFPELVALLPDIGKQQELAVGRDLPLGVCGTCGQLLAPRDTGAHDAEHWPPLVAR